MPNLLQTLRTADPGSTELLDAIEDAEDQELDMAVVDEILRRREEKVAKEYAVCKGMRTFRLWEGAVKQREERR